MFKKGNKDTDVLEMPQSADLKAVCQIAAGTIIEGAVNVKDANMRLDGEIIGTVFCAGKLLLSATAVIKGDVSCFELISEGKIEGNIMAKNAIVLLKTAHVQGDIQCKTLQIEAGARFNGQCSMPQDAAKN